MLKESYLIHEFSFKKIRNQNKSFEKQYTSLPSHGMPPVFSFEPEVHDIDGINAFSCFHRTHISGLTA
jgi:hypothetical protein